MVALFLFGKIGPCVTLARSAFINLRGVRGVPLLQYRLADWVRKEYSKQSAEYEFMRILLPKSQVFWRKLVYWNNNLRCSKTKS